MGSFCTRMVNEKGFGTVSGKRNRKTKGKQKRNRVSVFERVGNGDASRMLVKLSTVPEVENELDHRSSEEDYLPPLGVYPAYVKKLLTGCLDQPIKTKPQHIKLFISSTTEDFVVERKNLYTDIFPKLREYCADRDFELDIVDFHWKNQLDYFQDHSLWDICLKTLNDKSEYGRIFLVFLGTRYCESLVPPRIEATDFEAITYKIKDEVDISVLNHWYKLDNNSIPPCYVLRPVKSVISEYATRDAKTNKSGVQKWKETEANITRILLDNMTVDEMRRYLKPIYQEEIYNNILEHQDNAMKFVIVDRDFSQYPDSFSPNTESSKYFDVIDGQHNKPCRNRLESLKVKLRKVAPRSNVIDFNIPWNTTGIDSQTSLDHATYIHDLKIEAEDALSFGINVIIDEFENNFHPTTQIEDKNLLNELELQHAVLRELCSSFIGRETLIGELHSVISRKGNPIIVHGCEGVGKSLIAAAICATCHEVYPNLATVFRFLGATPDSQTLNSTLLTIQQQLILLYGNSGPIKYPMTKETFSQHLSRVTDSRPLIIILDGIEQTNEADEADYSWLPLDPPINVRILLTSSTEFMNKCVQKYKWGENEIEMFEVPKFSLSESSNLLTTLLKYSRRTITESQLQVVQMRLEAHSVPLYIVFLCQLAKHWSSEDTISESDLPKDTEGAITCILKKLQAKYGEEIVSTFLGFLSVSRHGLTELELGDLMSCNKAVMESVYPFLGPSIHYFSSGLIRALKVELGALLRSYTFRGRYLTVLSHEVVRSTLRKTYGDWSLLTIQMEKYFKNPLTDDGNKSALQSDTDVFEQARMYILGQPIKRKNIHNIRKYCELPWHGFNNETVSLSVNLRHYITDMNWLLPKLQVMGMTHVLQDTEHVYRKCKLKDIQILCGLVYTYGYENTLSELKSISRAVEQNFHELCPKLCEPPKPKRKVEGSATKRTLPVSNSKLSLVPQTHVLNNPISESKSNTETPITGSKSLFHFHDNSDRIISLDSENGELKIWDTNSMKVVRSISGLLKPLDLKMIDSDTAVLRCDRELKYYNLDDGQLLCKLKGVLHVKHSYFAPGEDRTVISLSRNRMAVNVIDLESGNLLSAFKAGEDRFLNSLYVSGDGKYCVCGDETQKPFPLLVWYLPERKLLHDFRFSRHEFITSIAGITKDGLYFVCACRELDASKNFLTLYDLHSGQLLSLWRTESPELSTSCLAICSDSCLAIAGLENGDVNVWDLESRALRFRIVGDNTTFDTISVSSNEAICVTCSSVGPVLTLTMWSIIDGKLLTKFTSGEVISAYILSVNGDHLMYFEQGKDKLFSWDIQKNTSKTNNKEKSKS